MKRAHLHRLASNNVVRCGERLGRQVVVVSGDIVVDIHPLLNEESFTEWLQEDIFVDRGADGLLHCFSSAHVR